jgi:kinesin family protein 4/21/27
MQEAHNQLQSTIGDLEQQLETHKRQQAEFSSKENSEHLAVVEKLQKDLDDHKASVAAYTTKFTELEGTHALTRQQLDEATQARDTSLSEILTHKSLISRLEQQILEH